MREFVEMLVDYSNADEAGRAGRAHVISAATQRAINHSGKGIDLTEADLSNLDLRGLDLRRATLNRTVLHGTRLDDADLGESTMVCPAMERTSLIRANLRFAYVHALAAQTCHFDECDFTGLRDATGTLFHGCGMRAAKLGASHLAGASFYQCDLSNSSFLDTNLQGATINECVLDEARFDNACVDQLTITKSSMRGTSLAGTTGRGLVLQRLSSADGLVLDHADLHRLRLDNIDGNGWRANQLRARESDFTDVSLFDAVFVNADFTGTNWRRCTMPSANLNSASFVNAKMANCSLRDLSASFLRAECLHIVECDLAGAVLVGAMARCLTARDSNFSGADLSRANLYRTMITGDPPSGMKLKCANLEGAILVQAYVAADLAGTNLTGANCAYSRMSQSDLTGANLNGTNFFQSTWVKTNLTDASLAGLTAPVFFDRCKGLAASVEKTGGETAEDFILFMKCFGDVLSSGRKGST